MKTRLLLIQPPAQEVINQVDCSVVDEKKVRVEPSYGLWCLAGAVARDNQCTDIKILDINLEVINSLHLARNTSPDAWVNILKNELRDFDPQLVGISCMFATTSDITIHISEITKEVCPEAIVCVGGPQVTSLTKPFLDCNAIDFAVLREGEKPFVSLIRALQNKVSYHKILSLAYRNSNGEHVINQVEPFSRELDEYLPFLDPDLIPFDRYSKLGRVSGLTNVTELALPFETSRGCPFECTFCAAPSLWDRRLRYKSIEHIERELDFYLSKVPFKHIYLLDDVPFLKKLRTIELLKLFKSKCLIPHFPNSLRVNSIDEEIIDALHNAGVERINIAIESGDQWVLKKLMKKNVDLDHTYRVVKYMREHTNIRTSGNILFGTPGEKISDMENTLANIRDIPVDFWSFGVIIPIPGSEIYEDLVEQGVDLKNMRHWDSEPHSYNIPNEDFSPKDLEEFVGRANEDMNFRNNLNVKEQKFDRAKEFFEHVVRMAPNFKLANEMLAVVNKELAGMV
jgi:anaerobic magnesium-protoporphyrin IX monomethyl ester cyclase